MRLFKHDYRFTDQKIYHKAIAQIPPKKIKRILEIGCSNESTVNILKETFPKAEIHGTEYIGWRGKIKKPRQLKTLKFLDLNKEKIPFKKGSFDLIVCNQVLEHILEIDSVLDQIHGLLKKGGFFVSGTPNLAALHERISLLFGYNPSMWHTANIQLGIKYPIPTDNRMHCNGFTVKGFRNLLEFHKFKPEKYYTTEVYLGQYVHIPFLARIFKNLALSQCWISQK